MTTLHRLSGITLAVLAAGLAAPAQAPDSYSYFGLGVGQARAHIDDTRIAQTLLGKGLGTSAVQGHADRIGTTAYNQTLSLERAEAVKAYLVSAARLDGSRIVATGKSESQPVTVPDAGQGAATAAVIACLQPDRRVMIDVTGVR